MFHQLVNAEIPNDKPNPKGVALIKKLPILAANFKPEPTFFQIEAFLSEKVLEKSKAFTIASPTPNPNPVHFAMFLIFDKAVTVFLQAPDSFVFILLRCKILLFLLVSEIISFFVLVAAVSTIWLANPPPLIISPTVLFEITLSTVLTTFLDVSATFSMTVTVGLFSTCNGLFPENLSDNSCELSSAQPS